MAHIYHASIMRLIPGLVLVTVVLGAFATAGFSSGERNGFFLAIPSLGALVVFYGFTIRRYIQPRVLIESDRVLIQRGKSRVIIQELGKYQLVLSRGWLGFRRNGAQDIMLDQADFSARSWGALVADLTALPFASVLSGSSNNGMQATRERRAPDA